MTISERVAYLRGLMEGLNFGNDTPEQKVLNEIVDILGDMADEIDLVEENVDMINDYCEELDEDLGAVEEFFIDDEDDEDYDDECDGDCSCCEEDCEFAGDDGDFFEAECPACGDTIYIDESLMEKGEVICPSCNKKLSIENAEDGTEE